MNVAALPLVASLAPPRVGASPTTAQPSQTTAQPSPTGLTEEEEFVQSEINKAGGQRVSGMDHKAGPVFVQGPYKGMTTGQAIEAARAKYRASKASSAVSVPQPPTGTSGRGFEGLGNRPPPVSSVATQMPAPNPANASLIESARTGITRSPNGVVTVAGAGGSSVISAPGANGARTLFAPPTKIGNPIGTGSVTHAPRTQPPRFNQSGTYDPNFNPQAATPPPVGAPPAPAPVVPQPAPVPPVLAATPPMASAPPHTPTYVPPSVAATGKVSPSMLYDPAKPLGQRYGLPPAIGATPTPAAKPVTAATADNGDQSMRDYLEKGEARVERVEHQARIDRLNKSMANAAATTAPNRRIGAASKPQRLASR